MKSYYFDDFHIGEKFVTGEESVSEADIVAFARTYDPQPFHIDPAAAAASHFGGIIASGFHTLSLSFALFFRLRLLEAANLGSPGMEDVRWIRPLRPGERIHVVAEVTALRPSQSKLDRGVVWMRHDTINQRGELVMSVNCLHMLKRRGAG
ncbi:MAG: MaoC family dehydratase [Alphaproteobacteria bacterium]|nr:MaoC family dehydratase [Alphaproteobacteria bacterium]